MSEIENFKPNEIGDTNADDNCIEHDKNDSTTSSNTDVTKRSEKILVLTIPEHIYVLDEFEILSYVEKEVGMYNEDNEIDPYLVLSREDADMEYLENADDYPNENEYFTKFYGGYRNENGDIVSTINTHGIFTCHTIEYFNNRLCQSVNDLIELICNDTISFDYLLHDSKLCSKNINLTDLPQCNTSCYFVVVKCVD